MKSVLQRGLISSAQYPISPNLSKSPNTTFAISRFFAKILSVLISTNVPISTNLQILPNFSRDLYYKLLVGAPNDVISRSDFPNLLFSIFFWLRSVENLILRILVIQFIRTYFNIPYKIEKNQLIFVEKLTAILGPLVWYN